MVYSMNSKTQLKMKNTEEMAEILRDMLKRIIRNFSKRSEMVVEEIGEHFKIVKFI